MGEEEPEPEKIEYDVTVLSRKEITLTPRLGQKAKQWLITYVAADLAPATITIMSDEYTLDLEKKMIREAVEERLEQRPEAYKV